MNTKHLFLFSLIMILNSISIYSAVDIKKYEGDSKENVSTFSSSGLEFYSEKFRKKSTSTISKRGRDLWKWKKKKKRNSSKEIPLAANLSAMLASFLTVCILFLGALGRFYSFTFPFVFMPFLAFGFVTSIILGVIGLSKINSDKERYEKKGRVRAWFGICLSLILTFLLLLLFISFI